MADVEGGGKVNLFYDKNDPNNMSQLMKKFIAGLLRLLPDLMPIYAPTINSYKRLVENYWAPVRVCWGYENRSAAVRVITPQCTGLAACSPLGTRIELRVPGADINSHLVMAAAFASGLYGIENNLQLPEPVKDGPSGERLARSLGEAVEKMASSQLATAVLGESFVNHYVLTRREEWEKWSRAVTQYEVERYFELV
jgi:glutamine synthetase